MREAYQEVKIDNRYISLGYDHCAEHEWGISDLQSILEVGRAQPESGIWPWLIPQKDRSTTLLLIDKRGYTSLTTIRGWDSEERRKCKERRRKLAKEAKKQDRPYSMWDGKGFFIMSWDSEEREVIREVYASTRPGSPNKVTMSLPASANPFAGSALTFFIFREEDMGEWEDLGKAVDERRAAQEAWSERWAEQTEGLYAKLRSMYSKLSVYSYTSNPWIYLAVKDEKGNWTFTPNKMNTDSGGTQLAWLNPAEQWLWKAGWYTAKDLWEWSEGRGKIWPLCAALPSWEHPFWASVKDLVPPPNKRGYRVPEDVPLEWPEFPHHGPEFFSPVYLDGYDFWGHAKRVCGFEVPNPRTDKGEHDWNYRRVRGAGYKKTWKTGVFSEPLLEAHEKGLTGLVQVTDLHKFLAYVYEWNANNPDNPVDYLLYGRNCDHLTEKLK